MAKRTQKNQDIKISIESSFKSMPYAAEVEKSILATMIHDPKIINTVLSFIKDESIFYSDANQKIFRVLKEFSETEKPENLNIPVLIEKLKDKNLFDDVGGVQYLLELSKMVESSENIESMCKILIEKFMLREIIRHCLYIANKCYDGNVDVFSILDEAEAGLFEISEHKYKKNYSSLAEVIEKTVAYIEQIKKSQVPGIPSGYNTLDVLTGGFQKSDLIIIAARPGVGKTAFALSIAFNISKQYPIGFFSLEMKNQQLGMRLLSQASRIDFHKLKVGGYGKEEQPNLLKAIRIVGNTKFYVDDTPAITLHELRAKARRMISEHDVKIIFIDYLQLIQGPANAESREREISFISRGLKALAKELDIPIVALAQLNRQVEIRQTKRPMLSDLRESGAIEQDADIVCFLHRPDLYAKPSDEATDFNNPFDAKTIEVIIAKQRNGPTGSFELVFLPKYTRFEEKSLIDFTQNVQKQAQTNQYSDYPIDGIDEYPIDDGYPETPPF